MTSGLIGTGWYGKSDLFRLMQVAPIEVVGLCDVDARQLKQATEMVNERKPQKNLQTYRDHRQMLRALEQRFRVLQALAGESQTARWAFQNSPWEPAARLLPS